jgi:hypothetical protein
MSWKTLPSVRRVVTVKRGYRACDGCGKRLPAKTADDCTSLFLGPQFRAHLYVGACCDEKLQRALRGAGFRFRLRALKPEAGK